MKSFEVNLGDTEQTPEVGNGNKDLAMQLLCVWGGKDWHSGLAAALNQK